MGRDMYDVGVIDLGIGNILSVVRMVEKLGATAAPVKNVNELDMCKKIVLPGVGSFDSAMTKIRELAFDEALERICVREKRPVLGICLGMQILSRRSEEGKLSGLGLLEADVLKFNFKKENQLKIPHMGWNTIQVSQPNKLLRVSEPQSRFYFVHSYYVKLDDSKNMIGSTQYGIEFCSAFQKDNLYGVQFHPEKSHRYGLQLFDNFMGV